jgi:hypothetical protein
MRTAERLARAAAQFPTLTAFRGTGYRVTGLSCGPIERVSPAWVNHLVPPNQRPADLVRAAVKQAADRFNATGARLALSVDELLGAEEIETYPIESLPDGTPMTATLVNTVYKSEVNGASVYVPWATSRERVHAISPVMVMQRLLGVASILDAQSTVRQFRISYRAPFRCNHDICPAQLKVQETGAMNSVMGEFTLNVTAAMHAIACDLPRLRVSKRRCDNRVYVAYLPFKVSVTRLVDVLAGCKTKRTRFGGTVVEHPELQKIRLIVFPTGVVICVGAKQTELMRAAFARFMERLYRARVTAADLRLLDGEPSAAKRPRLQ